MMFDKEKSLPWIGGILIGTVLSMVLFTSYLFYMRTSKIEGNSIQDSVPSPLPINIKPPSIANKVFLAENTIADIAQRTSDSVVNIDISSNINVSDNSFSPLLPFKGFDFFFGPGFGNGQGMPRHK